MSTVTLPLTFRAVGQPTPGAPLEAVTRTVQSLQADEVLARVSYAAINAADGKAYNATVNFFQLPLPLVLGFDFSGVIVALGAEEADAGKAEALTVGSAVTGSAFGIGWGAGAFAEYVVAKRNRVTLRGDIPEPEAAALNAAFLSAFEPLCISGDLKKHAGQTIFIPGGAGGVGHFGVQLAKAYGLRVIASASKPEGLELLRKLGVDVVLDYSKQDVVAEVLAATGGKGADVVFDATNMESGMKQSAAVVAKGGEWVRLGTWKGSPPEQQAAVEGIIAARGGSVVLGDWGRYAVNPDYIAKTGELMKGMAEGKRLYAEGLLRPHISATIPLEPKSLQQALQESLKGAVGKVVVKVQ